MKLRARISFDSSSITASAVCLFMLDRQFYHVFTGPAHKSARNKDITDLIVNCPNHSSSAIDRETVESERQFLPWSFNPLLMETMSAQRFTALHVIQHRETIFCLIIGTSE
jgi:hypothetical protein